MWSPFGLHSHVHKYISPRTNKFLQKISVSLEIPMLLCNNDHTKCYLVFFLLNCHNTTIGKRQFTMTGNFCFTIVQNTNKTDVIAKIHRQNARCLQHGNKITQLRVKIVRLCENWISIVPCCCSWKKKKKKNFHWHEHHKKVEMRVKHLFTQMYGHLMQAFFLQNRHTKKKQDSEVKGGTARCYCCMLDQNILPLVH